MALLTPTADQMHEWQDALHVFERSFTYPLGNDHFYIDHGSNYLAFFERLGVVAPVLATRRGTLTGILVAVQRKIESRDHWYLCDLKVAQNGGHRFLAPRLLRTWAKQHLQPEQPAYGVSMNQSSGHNRLARAAKWWPATRDIQAEPLVLFSLGHEQWLTVESAVQAALGPVTWFDPHEIKDIVLQSTGKPMPLLHAQHGPLGNGNGAQPQPGCTHMFCLPANDPLVQQLHTLGIAPDATATILHRNCEHMNWLHLLTSDI